MHTSTITLGSARATTLASGEGKTMELIPGLFYEVQGAAPATELGSARASTLADTDGPRSELVPELRYQQAGDA